ncbi:MAG TPA: T9SS type A sorting domain-containing protein [Bacteroidota bacterium]|nr:T9SS type A sorting domain-containing protein [Bacteroidota bacterium]
MLSGAPQMWGQAVDTINYKWAKSIGGTVADAKFHPITGNILAAVNTSVGEIWEIDPNTGETIRIMEQPEGLTTSEIRNLHITPDGKEIWIRTTQNPTCLRYDYASGKFEKMLKSGVGGGFFPDSRRVLGGCGSRICIYDYVEDTIIASYNPRDFYMPGPDVLLDNMALSPDGKYIAMVFKNQYNPYWYPILVSVDSMKAVKDGYFWMNDDESIGEEPTDIKWSKDSKYVGLKSNKLRIFDVSEWINSKWQSGKYVFNGVWDYDFSSDSKALIIQDPNTSIIKIIDIISNNIRVYLYSLVGGGGHITSDNDPNFISYGMYKYAFYDYSSVGVKEPKGQATPIQTIQYQQGILTITVNTQEPINKITITDIAGKTLYQFQQVASTDGIVQIPIKLVVGTYFITMQIGKSIYNEKLLVVW